LGQLPRKEVRYGLYSTDWKPQNPSESEKIKPAGRRSHIRSLDWYRFAQRDLSVVCYLPRAVFAKDIANAIEGDLSGCALVIDLFSFPNQRKRRSDVRDLLSRCIRNTRERIPYRASVRASCFLYRKRDQGDSVVGA